MYGRETKCMRKTKIYECSRSRFPKGKGKDARTQSKIVHKVLIFLIASTRTAHFPTPEDRSRFEERDPRPSTD